MFLSLLNILITIFSFCFDDFGNHVGIVQDGEVSTTLLSVVVTIFVGEMVLSVCVLSVGMSVSLVVNVPSVLPAVLTVVISLEVSIVTVVPAGVVLVTITQGGWVLVASIPLVVL